MTRLEQMVHASERLQPRSKAIYAAAVRSFIAFGGADERRWAPAMVQAWRDSLRAMVAPQTVNVMLRGLRFAFRRFAAMQHGGDAAAPIEYVAEGGKRRRPDALTAAQARKLFATVEADTSLVGLRDHIILCLGIFEGFRRDEMVHLCWIQQRGLTLRDVVRKGGETEPERIIDQRTAGALDRLFAATTEDGAGDPILTRARNCVGCQVRPLSTSGIYAIVQARASQAGLRVAPHELRHTCGSLLLQAGVPPWRVAKHLGHASEVTTLRTYAHDLPAREGDTVGGMITRLLELPTQGGTR